MTTDSAPTRTYRAVPAMLDLPAMERQILDFWASNDTFAASLARTEGGRPWTFFEGPPTANGMPGTHHIEARVFKDVFPRFKTMQGYRVDRKAGWDCHGLPAEMETEKQLGVSGRAAINEYGIANFNGKITARHHNHIGGVDDFLQRADRFGALDLGHQQAPAAGLMHQITGPFHVGAGAWE